MQRCRRASAWRVASSGPPSKLHPAVCERGVARAPRDSRAARAVQGGTLGQPRRRGGRHGLAASDRVRRRPRAWRRAGASAQEVCAVLEAAAAARALRRRAAGARGATLGRRRRSETGRDSLVDGSEAAAARRARRERRGSGVGMRGARVLRHTPPPRGVGHRPPQLGRRRQRPRRRRQHGRRVVDCGGRARGAIVLETRRLRAAGRRRQQALGPLGCQRGRRCRCVGGVVCSEQRCRRGLEQEDAARDAAVDEA
mmetsp:Transcript_25435/g.76936  ORF Transcript_25435/g.76936 Transcript_25435/m.76936 type:complete len:255 (-) Transcript_25435:332-1096(-)